MIIEMSEQPRRCEGFARYRVSCMGTDRTFRLYTPSGALELERGVLPVLITLHGGDYARAHERTTWHELAEEKQFLVLYPESLGDGIQWNVWETLNQSEGRADDVAYLDYLITILPQLFGADSERIYLHGQSCGDMLGMNYCYVHPERVAAAFLCSGPTKTMYWMTPEGKLRFHPNGPCPVMRLHGEHDVFEAGSISSGEAHLYKQQCHVERNAMPWLHVNGCIGEPVFFINKRFNAAFYQGRDGCDFIDLFTKDGVHRPPQELEREAWERFFTAYRLVDGRHIKTEPEKGSDGDADTEGIAVAAGSSDFLMNGRRLKSDGGKVLVKNRRLYLDRIMLEGISGYLEQAGVLSRSWLAGEDSVNGAGRVNSANSSGNAISLAQLPWKDDVITFEAAMNWIGYCQDEVFDAGYASKTPFRLTFDLAYTIRRVLNVQNMLSDEEAYLLEKRIFVQQQNDHQFSVAADRKEAVWQWGHVT